MVQTPAIREVVNTGRRLILLNRTAHYGRSGLIVSGPARTGKTTALTQLGKTIEAIHRRRHPYSSSDIPVLYITVPPAATPRMIAMEFARFLGLPLTRRANLADITEAVRGVCHQHICLRHRLWISPAGIPQLDLTACPAITRAQHHARYLAHRFGAQQLMFAQLAAERETRNMPYRPTPEPPPRHWRHRLQRLRNTNPQADIAITHDQFIRAALYADAIDRAAKRLDQMSKIY